MSEKNDPICFEFAIYGNDGSILHEPFDVYVDISEDFKWSEEEADWLALTSKAIEKAENRIKSGKENLPITDITTCNLTVVIKEHLKRNESSFNDIDIQPESKKKEFLFYLRTKEQKIGLAVIHAEDLNSAFDFTNTILKRNYHMKNIIVGPGRPRYPQKG